MSFNPKVALWSGATQNIDYTPSGATSAGDVVIVNGIPYFAQNDIAASALGALAFSGGVWKGNKITGAISRGDEVYWKATADPVTGTAGTGAFQASSSGATFVGYAVAAAASGDQFVYFVKGQVAKRYPTATVAVGGTAQANANAVTEGFTVVTGADNTAAVVLPSAVRGAVVILKSTTSGKTLQVFPAASDKINGAAANAVYNMANLSQRVFVAYDETDWYTAPETIT